MLLEFWGTLRWFNQVWLGFVHRRSMWVFGGGWSAAVFPPVTAVSLPQKLVERAVGVLKKDSRTIVNRPQEVAARHAAVDTGRVVVVPADGAGQHGPLPSDEGPLQVAGGATGEQTGVGTAG